MQNMLKRSLLFGLASLGAVVGIGVWTTGSIRSAQAQSTTSAESHSMIFKSGGPLQLQDGERALIGLLLPAVKKARVPFRLVLSDAQGHSAELKLDPPASGNLLISFALTYVGGSLQLVEPKTGAPLGLAVPGDGMFTALLLPAVQKGGKTVGGLAASIQLFGGDGARTGIVQMCDGGE